MAYGIRTTYWIQKLYVVYVHRGKIIYFTLCGHKLCVKDMCILDKCPVLQMQIY